MPRRAQGRAPAQHLPGPAAPTAILPARAWEGRASAPKFPQLAPKVPHTEPANAFLLLVSPSLLGRDTLDPPCGPSSFKDGYSHGHRLKQNWTMQRKHWGLGKKTCLEGSALQWESLQPPTTRAALSRAVARTAGIAVSVSSSTG